MINIEISKKLLNIIKYKIKLLYQTFLKVELIFQHILNPLVN